MKLRFALAASTLAMAGLAHSATIDWNQWTSNSTGTIASTPVTITFTGQNNGGWSASYPSYGPAPTWADGSIVSNAPTGGIVVLSGGNTNVQTVTFSQAVTNPIFAIWSLGQGGVNASFNFIGATPVFVSGGASNEYGGLPIVVSGNNVSGNEGNGTVEFLGTYTSLSWTNPTYEYWYGFNVGITGVSPAVPEPASIGLLLAGLTLVGLARRRKTR